MKKAVKHMGFKKAAEGVMKKEGVSKKSANAIIASASRNASPKAKAKNPALKKVVSKKK